MTLVKSVCYYSTTCRVDVRIPPRNHRRPSSASRAAPRTLTAAETRTPRSKHAESAPAASSLLVRSHRVEITTGQLAIERAPAVKTQ
eukprot:6198279-Pleurochrysis_carterae.AAC.1